MGWLIIPSEILEYIAQSRYPDIRDILIPNVVFTTIFWLIIAYIIRALSIILKRPRSTID